MKLPYIIVAILVGVATAVSGLCTITPVDVGGRKFDVHHALLSDHSDSHVFQHSNCVDYLFFDRNPDNFALVLDHLRFGGTSVLPLTGKIRHIICYFVLKLCTHSLFSVITHLLSINTNLHE